MSGEEFLEPSLAGHLPERGIDVGFRHDEREGSIECLGFRGRREDLSCFVELGLIDADMFVPDGRCGRHSHLSIGMYIVTEFMYTSWGEVAGNVIRKVASVGVAP